MMKISLIALGVAVSLGGNDGNPPLSTRRSPPATVAASHCRSFELAYRVGYQRAYNDQRRHRSICQSP